MEPAPCTVNRPPDMLALPAAPTAPMSAVCHGAGSPGAALTVTYKGVLPLNCPSLTATVIAALPACPGAGLTVTVRLLPPPPNTMLLTGTRTGFDELPLTVSCTAAVSTSHTRNGMGPVVPPALIV